jgi:DNA-binding beta-propeller fold protein YncE
MNYLIAIFGLLLLVGCNKNKPLPPAVPDRYENGILVLNEGLFEQNNASITFYNGTEVYQQVFKSENNRGLGDTANDFEAYELNGERYVIVAVDISSQLEIFSQTTLKSVAQIPLFDAEGNAREPRLVKVVGDKAYSCNFDGTIAVINLHSFQVVDLISVGANPDGMAISNDKLFISNSGGLH